MFAADKYKDQFEYMSVTLFEDLSELVAKPTADIDFDTASEIEKIMYIEDYKTYKKDDKSFVPMSVLFLKSFLANAPL